MAVRGPSVIGERGRLPSGVVTRGESVRVECCVLARHPLDRILLHDVTSRGSADLMRQRFVHGEPLELPRQRPQASSRWDEKARHAMLHEIGDTAYGGADHGQ